jgi:aspartyl-tRNA(Asn)/glutamyl-tRNA(Gln) amidotransferase subunit C
MSVDIETVKKIARLSRIAIDNAEAEKMVGELNGNWAKLTFLMSPQ